MLRLSVRYRLMQTKLRTNLVPIMSTWLDTAYEFRFQEVMYVQIGETAISVIWWTSLGRFMSTQARKIVKLMKLIRAIRPTNSRTNNKLLANCCVIYKLPDWCNTVTAIGVTHRLHIIMYYCCRYWSDAVCSV